MARTKKTVRADGPDIPDTALLREQEYEIVEADRLRCHPLNKREGDIGAIHGSIGAHKFYGALIAQRSTGLILKGNHSFQAGVQKGIGAFPVFWIKCDDKEAVEILLIDNRTSDLASWDNAGLAALLQSIQADTGDLGGTGFDQDALDNLLADLAVPTNGAGSQDVQTVGNGVMTCPRCGYEFGASQAEAG